MYLWMFLNKKDIFHDFIYVELPCEDSYHLKGYLNMLDFHMKIFVALKGYLNMMDFYAKILAT